MADNKRSHKATYARDKRQGGYLIRVEGPRAGDFAGFEVPVTRMGSTEDTKEKLTALVWKGTDEKTGKPVALYHFEPRPREEVEAPEF